MSNFVIFSGFKALEVRSSKTYLYTRGMNCHIPLPSSDLLNVATIQSNGSILKRNINE